MLLQYRKSGGIGGNEEKNFKCNFDGWFVVLADWMHYSTVENEGKAKEESTPSMFVCVEQAATWKIVYHRDTKVMYAISYYGSGSGEFTLLVNADGTPMLWEK